MRKRLTITFIALTFVIGHLSFCFAVRPLYTEDARVTPKSVLLLESGLLLLTNRDNTGVKELSTAFKYGFGKKKLLQGATAALEFHFDQFVF